MLPPVRSTSTSATALFLDTIPGSGGRRQLRTEPARVLNSAWAVRRNGRLVPLADVRPEPAALQLPDGSVVAGVTGWWPDLREFLRTNGIDPATAKGVA